MRVLVDTPVWSEFLRRVSPQEDVHNTLRKLVVEGSCALIGPIRQEILSGIKDHAQFKRICHALSAFPDEPILTSDYETAAGMFNKCRSCGIQGSNTDFLICALARRLKVPIFTLDRDFERFKDVLSIGLLKY